MSKQIEKRKIEDLPEEIPILPIRNLILFPKMILPMMVGRKSSMEAVKYAVKQNSNLIGTITQKDAEEEFPTPGDLFTYGTLGTILNQVELSDDTIKLLMSGDRRFKVKEYVSINPFLVARVEYLEEEVVVDIEVQSLMANIKSLFQSLSERITVYKADILSTVMNLTEPHTLADFVASHLNINIEEKQKVLETIDIKKRLRLVAHLVNKELEMLEIGAKIHSKVKEEIDKKQKEFYLREQIKAIKRELGEDDEEEGEIASFRQRIKQANMPKYAEEVALKELDRMSKMHQESAEYTGSRNYLTWLCDLPWSRSTQDNLNLEEVEKILDEDHYGLKKVKERILEFIAVRTLKARRNEEAHSPIICFLGPPGVGKTSLGRSIARALGRKFERIALGGIHDEAEIRGHRRTYIGAMPGKIIAALKKTGVNNPLIMLDEIDKVGKDFRGDPASALLEVLDPEQNNSFVDHYIDLKFDLSKVMFITTANQIDTIPPPLLDRMEVIEINGYTMEEKVHIARQFLIPKQIKANGLDEDSIKFTRSAIETIISDYTRESGVRNLEREIANVCRKIAIKVVKGHKGTTTITANNLERYLGIKRFMSEVRERTSIPGVAIGLAWTPFGGDILFIEATMMRGKGALVLTGKLGDVMMESAKTALSYIRSKAHVLNIDPEIFEKHDIHIHVPAGAVPKDGPSAGITIAVALCSLLQNRLVRNDTAMTGEITLRGRVLPVGGIKEKVLAAVRNGINRIVLPARNKKDTIEIPREIKKKVEFIFVDDVQEVFKHTIDSFTFSPLPDGNTFSGGEQHRQVTN